VIVLDREINMSWSRFASEIVTCRLPDRRELRMLCKYEVDGEKTADEHRGGLWYEAEVDQQRLKGSTRRDQDRRCSLD